MDPAELGRWTRFASKGGIGRCTAVQDCVAESPDDLMFMKGDNIVVLVQLQEQQDTYLGYCEGVVGRFEGSYVQFHSKLKKPIVTRRSSTTSSSAPSPRPSSRSPAPSPRITPLSLQNHDLPRFRFASEVTSEVTASESDISKLTSPVSSNNPFTPQLASSSSSSSAAESLPGTPADLILQPDTKERPSDGSSEPGDESLLYPNRDFDDSFITSEPSTRISVATYDGVEGIGLSLLQDFIGENGYDSSSESGSDRSNNQTPEPGQSDSLESTIDAHEPQDSDQPISVMPLNPNQSTHTIDRSETSSQRSSHPSEYSEDNGEEWEGASDIYDDYRYSRFSMASKLSRQSKASFQMPPPVPIDHRSIIDSVASSDRQIASPEQNEPSPLLHTRFGTPPTPRVGLPVSQMNDPTTSDRSLHSQLERTPNSSLHAPHSQLERTPNPSQPTEVQMPRIPDNEARLAAEENEHHTDRDDVTPRLIANDSHIEPVSSASSDQSLLLESQVKHMESTTSTPTVMSYTPHTFISPSAGLLGLQNYRSSSPERILPPNHELIEPFTPAQPRPHPRKSNEEFHSPRRSLFLPHPGAPKAPNTIPSGPLYGRVQQPAFRPPLLPQIGPPSLFELLRMAGTLRYHPNGAPRQTTIYGKCEIELSDSMGPVPISWSLEPPMSVPANRLPTRSQTSPHIHHLAFPQLQETPRRSVSNREFHDAAVRRENATTDSFLANPASVSNSSPRPPESRRRSRSFSSFVAALKPTLEKSTNIPSTTRHSSSSQSSQTIASNPSPKSRHFPSIVRSHQPSPLSISRTTASAPSPPIVGKTRVPSSPLASPSSPTAPTAHTFASSHLVSGFGMSGPSQTSSSQTPIARQGLDSKESSSSSPKRVESASPPLSRNSLPAVDSFVITPDVPGSSMSPSLAHTLSHARRSVVAVTESASASGMPRGRESTDTDVSRYSDTRSTSISSHSITTVSPTPAATKHLSLRTKISLSALRAKSGVVRAELQEGVTPSTNPNEETQDLETVQVEDMDFELVTPIIPRVQSPQPSVDSFPGRVREISSPYSPLQPDGASFLQAESPTTSMTSPAISGSDVSLPFKDSLNADPSNTHAASIPESMSREEMQAHRHRELKWVSLMSSVPPAQAKKSKKIKKLLLDGVPSSVRYQVWAHLADCKAKRMNGLYSQLTKRGEVPASSTIERDVALYFEDQPQSKDGSVVSVLQAYLNMVPDIHYHRALTCIVGQLLAQAPEEDAFWIFISMMDAHLRPYFSSNPVQMEVDASLFAKALEANEPSVAKKLFVSLGVKPMEICRPWFSCLFFDTLPADYHLRVWDVFLFEGIPFLFRIGLALFSCCRRALLDSQSEEGVIAVLSRIPLPSLPPNPDGLIALAMSAKLKDDDLRRHRSKMEVQLKRQTQARALKPSLTGGAAPISLPRS